MNATGLDLIRGAVNILYLAAALLLVAVILFWQAYRGRNALGLPAGRVIYDDMRGWGSVEQPLYDAELGLVGKPDYLVEIRRAINPGGSQIDPQFEGSLRRSHIPVSRLLSAGTTPAG